MSCETESNEVVSIQPIARVQIPTVEVAPVGVVVSDIPHVGVAIERNV